MTETTGIQDFVYAIATSPGYADDGVCFAARATGLYRSEDGGVTWHQATDSLELTAPLVTPSVVVSPDFGSDRSVFAGVNGGILHSVDGGQRWFIASVPSPPPMVSALVTSPAFTHDGTLFAGTMEDGVFRSADRGSHWHRWNFGLLDLNILALAVSPDFAADETLFAGTESGVFRSTNGGRAWREVEFPVDLAPVLALALSPDYANDGVLFAGTESYGLHRSPDRGHTWERLGQTGVTEGVNGLLLSPQYPAKADVLVITGETLLISRDAGHSWSDCGPDRVPGRQPCAVAAPQGLDATATLLVGLTDGSVRPVPMA
jgi:photosystem II stability/assembly factor-like uncharacterized protein